jgi:RimJ/RimL family protein N-acetyltransferase
MPVELVDIYTVDRSIACALTWKLLSEREAIESISHRKMPLLAQHEAFHDSHPYKFWYAIKVEGRLIGTCYLTKLDEVGIAVLVAERGRGYARAALTKLISDHPGPLLANIAPQNDKSRILFKSLGFDLIQTTYRRD